MYREEVVRVVSCSRLMKGVEVKGRLENNGMSPE